MHKLKKQDAGRGFLTKAKTIVLVGTGNIGSRLAWELALLNPERIVIIDPDRVTRRNLQCCSTFSADDLGQHKVAVLATRLRAHFSACRLTVVSVPQSLEQISLAALRDLTPCILVGAVDSRRARYQLAETAMILGLPLVDLAIAAGADQLVARVEVSWYTIKAIDPLNAWSAADWAALEQVQPCAGQVAIHGRSGHIASPISGSLAASLGTAAARKLLAGDAGDVGFVTRCDLSHGSFVRCALPPSGHSPLDPAHVICQTPMRVGGSTLGALVDDAERLLGPRAEVILRRDVSSRFGCCNCQHVELQPSVVGCNSCSKCGGQLTPLEPTSTLSRLTVNPFAATPIGRLGTAHDLLRVTNADGSSHLWIEYSDSP